MRVGRLPEGKNRFVDKLPGNFANVGLIRLILPEARIIHARRDPVDACLSCYAIDFESPALAFTYDMSELGRYCRDYLALMAHWRSVLPETHFLEVDYEAVVDDLEREARRMLDFLGLPWDPACLEFHRTRRSVRTASVNQVRRPIYRSVGRALARARRLSWPAARGARRRGASAFCFWRDIGVVNLPTGQPTMRLTGGAAARLAAITPAGMEAFIAPDHRRRSIRWRRPFRDHRGALTRL